MVFALHRGLKRCKTSPRSTNANFTSLFWADSIEQYGRRDNIRFFGVEENTDGDEYDRLVEVTNDIGVTISKQDISVCHRLPSLNQGSRPKIAKFVRCETKFHVVTHKRKFENSPKKLYNNDDVTLLRVILAKVLRQHPDVKHVDMFTEKVLLTMSNGKRHVFKILIRNRTWNLLILFVTSLDFFGKGHFK